jgi:hypothetical protein
MIDPELQFVQAAKQHGLHTIAGEPTAVNAAYDEIVAALQVLRASPDRGQRFLETCLTNNDPSVVCWAALYLLPFKERAATAALKRVARGKSWVAFDAQMTLDEWRAGRLKVD